MKDNSRTQERSIVEIRRQSADGTLGRAAIVAHGGAWDIPEALHQESIEGCREAAEVGWSVLMKGGPAIDAVEAAVRVLEDASIFDAGRGSVLNARGEIELDAMIMDGRDLDLGAVMAVKGIRHPITLARLVMTASAHTILAGEGAEAFARQQGMPPCPIWALVVDREAERWRARDSNEQQTASPSEAWPLANRPGDTVGAVAMDAHGHLAAATSTGGTFNKHPGRVGDSPLVGCGAYADDQTGAVSATGEGEALMKIVISKSAADFLAQGMTAQQAADAAIHLLRQRTNGSGGVVMIGKRGDVGISHCTPYLAHACITSEGRVLAGVQATAPDALEAAEGPRRPQDRTKKLAGSEEGG